MATSEARIQANRENAKRSTGPVTEQGKSISRANSLKHGLTGAGIVMPKDDEAEVERRAQAYGEEMNVNGEIGVALARCMALGSVRMERGLMQQTAAMTIKINQVIADFEVPEGVDEAGAKRLLAETVKAAMLDDSKQAILARKYEAAAERSFFRSLKELQKMRKQAEARIDASADELLGSILNMRKQDAEMEAFYAKMEKTLPPMPANSPYLGPMKGRVDVPITVGQRR